jgi:glycosyltransferase involved in cell wall biosynthesis
MPVIASAQGETERVIKEAECGVCSKIGDATELAEAIRYMMQADLAKMGKNSRQYFVTHFDKQNLMNEMEELF